MTDSASTPSTPDDASAAIEPDAVLLGAVDVARAALLEITPASTIGELVGHVVHEQHVLSLHFASLMSGYPDWHWTATLSRIDENSEPNVLETELLPGESAVLAPEWTPWSDRLEDYKLAQELSATLAENDDDDDESDDDDIDGDHELDLDDHIIDDDILDDAVHEHAAELDASVLVRADDENDGDASDDDEFGSAAGDHEIDPHEEGLTVVSFADDEPRSSVYYDEDAPRDL
ncbi:DUF3027 domain-containing protein [Agreia sp. COWG]|uniref:DUF3027 domain-containing protein n=1 Tax=Agreia sp. COWG TaxID=2773266 RepID=UPI001927CAD9|nr:DUF3027 domain-containing protein [Agreia sp. COWG]CAD6003519.1 conserved protein of unknown function [Agreia sp. COWG]